MTYANLLSEESVESQYLIILRPRRIVTETWNLVSGAIYYASFEFGTVTKVTSDGEVLTQESSAAVGLNEWYFDETLKRLYINIGADPTSSQVVSTFEIYLGTFDAHFNRDPLDSNSTVVYYEPLVVRSPQVVTSASDVLFGFLPTFSGTITISNVTNFLQKYLYDSSFNRGEVEVYHWLDELTTANVKLILKGYTQSYKVTDVSIDFNILDATSFFDTQWRNLSGISFYNQTLFANLDPNFVGRPIRQAFGVVEGFIPVNIDYVSEAPTTSDNRTWVCLTDETNLGSVSTTVLSSPSSTTTRTYLTSADGFRVGDSFYNQTKNISQYITAVNKTGSHYIEHDVMTAASSGDTVKRSFVGNVSIVKDGTIYRARYGRDYLEYTDATNKVCGFTFNTTLESNLSLTGNLLPTDKVFCRIYGHKNTTTMGGSPFGSNSAETGNLTNPFVIWWYMLASILGIPEDELDDVVFTSLAGSETSEIGLAVPFSATSEFTTFKEIISQLCQSLLTKFFLNNDLVWTARKIAPLGSTTKNLEDDEILDGSFAYDFSYSDIISRALVEYQARETSEDGGSGIPLTVDYENTTTKNLHLIERQKTFQSLFFKSSDALVLAKRLAFALGDRLGIASFRTKFRFFDTLLNDVVEISRDQMPGFEYDVDTLNTRSFSVNETARSLTEISITLTDQRGIEDNSGDW